MYQEIIDFWFVQIDSKQWWQKDLNFDSTIQSKFGSSHNQAKAGELYHWRDTALGSLAEIIVLDQFSRNIYRDDPRAFECDPVALALAQTAISKGFDSSLPQTQRSFFYLPFMHSESQIIHKEAVKLYELLGNKTNLEFELQHKKIIDKFGRYPHRNSILGRQSTSDEVDFLKLPNSGF